MYRQINITEHQRDLQRIAWREDETDKIKHFRLKTVTYGTSSASYLAIRSLYQVALEQRDNFPKAGDAILDDFYVDDLLSGSDTIENGIQLKNDLSFLLEQYGFKLRKWVSNNAQILEKSQVANEDRYLIAEDETKCTLMCLMWKAKSDILTYNIDESKLSSNKTTKRTILSSISKIFDPLGLISPVTIRAKIMLQKLWQHRLGWDESLPSDLIKLWLQYKEQLPDINSIQQYRQVVLPNFKDAGLHCFCDASTNAYGAFIYLKSTNVDGDTVVRLLCSKTRVAPLKVITLPRLELSGAVLLVQLYQKVVNSMKVKIEKVLFWTDSTIVLSWIAAPPSNWKIFVANRVSEIQGQTKIEQWRHIPTKDNPADILTRGMDPKSLSNCSLW